MPTPYENRLSALDKALYLHSRRTDIVFGDQDSRPSAAERDAMILASAQLYAAWLWDDGDAGEAADPDSEPCPSCMHERRFHHDPDGCWFTVTLARGDRSMVLSVLGTVHSDDDR
jgi:hypothetical protein